MSEKFSLKSLARNVDKKIIDFPQSRASTRTDASGTMGKTITCNEQTSIKALTSYVAHNKGVSEDLVRAVVQGEFNVDDIAALRQTDYERAVRFLVDLQIDLLIN